MNISHDLMELARWHCLFMQIIRPLQTLQLLAFARSNIYFEAYFQLKIIQNIFYFLLLCLHKRIQVLLHYFKISYVWRKTSK